MTQNNNISDNQTNLKADKKFIPYQEQAADLNALREVYGLTEQEYQRCVNENVSYFFELECPVSELLDTMDYIRTTKPGFEFLTDEMLAAEYKIIQPQLFSDHAAFKKQYEKKIKKYEDASWEAYYKARHLDVCPTGAKAHAENVVIEGERKQIRRIVLIGSVLSGLAVLGAWCTGFYAWNANKQSNTPKKIDNEAKLIQKAHVKKAQNTR